MSEKGYRKAVRYILDQVELALSDHIDQNVDDVINIILSSKQIFVYGVGRSGIIGKAFAMRLVQMGFKVYFIGETITPVVEKEDAVILVSNTGETMSAIQTAEISKRVGAKSVVITSNPDSALAKLSSGLICIRPRIEKGSERRDMAPLGTLFEISALVLLDGIVAQIMREKGETEKSMSNRHAIMV
jgi:6-phospho-3-hexuloisomerase